MTRAWQRAVGVGLAMLVVISAFAWGFELMPAIRRAASAAPCGTEVEACGAHGHAASAAAPSRIEGRPRMLVFSSQSCPACKRMKPRLESAVKACDGERDVYPVDFDSDAGEVVAASYGVTLLPTFLSIDATGGEVARLSGVLPQEQLERALEEIRGVRCASVEGAVETKAM